MKFSEDIFSKDIFFEMTCLTESSTNISGRYLHNKFKGSDKRYIGQALQKFVDYNRVNFAFLNVTPIISGSDANTTLSFRSDKFVGTIPLRSPDTGKQIGDFVVSPRFLARKDRFTDYIEIIDLISKKIEPEFKDTIPLVSGRNLSPPLYFEAVKYLKLLNELVKTNWKKFQTNEKTYDFPKSQINWNNYLKREFDPTYKLKFPCKENILSKFHLEYFEIKYVYEFAKNEINSVNTPQKIRLSVDSLISYLDNKLKNFNAIETKIIKIKNSDPIIVKHVKIQANKILQNNIQINKAWRVDFSDVFEKYVQYIFKNISSEIGGHLLTNYRLKKSSHFSPLWSLEHLEPDAMLIKDDLMIFIDAKYKSHLYNTTSISDFLKEEHRHDIHQILSYCSFDLNKNKIGILCYPSYQVDFQFLNYTNQHNKVINKIGLLGVPLNKSKINDLKSLMIKEISNLEPNTNLILNN
ncbi:MAG: hypothetical protein MPEBLZ_01846 [Candidatus Methanoperedens nitroreducens]|uniref:McrBC 5-methylcytosine restriction system component n=1 Tax=Candidatus Methanoperedens nitratireducens TaxID=1392998 RepID=A0A0P7ZFU1_9EURY|nr:hypothetical protein [Candidatus Methanoperedens sp. BLZ2]KAB2948413.1 MAG: hypothetical protein F9K14_00865 [Candidatus Methanoperedens sp.]KPQ43660.1 MAG: hypothetical protein MPEBLZ_01846 [Candidatus Methanoperedens sp. BLZ1]MBZ0174497.1 hypothetical protein [Candidatus Methanoperedens nitroreducens]CAG0996841.1 hypothetical protein METP2_02978 [Methanosarcinales archaeon]MCX9078520.1 hypothetical protein [Candidatus Methanoperedens sp.]